MKNKLLVMLSVLLVVLGVTVTSVAQDDLPEGWPEGCQLPDLEAAMNAANEAQADGDVTAFLNSMSEINELVDGTFNKCLKAAVEDDADLSEAKLWEANLFMGYLPGANLEDALLGGANLSRANLSGANLQRARFYSEAEGIGYTNLQDANLSNANLQGADLRTANLQWTDLSGANLQGAWLHEANLFGANLEGANLQGTDLRWANLQNANLTDVLFDEDSFLPNSSYWTPNTNMAIFTNPTHPDFWRGYGLSRQNLSGMDFSDANLQVADLWWANLKEVDLSGANLQEAYLSKAELQGADLTGANLQYADLPGVTGFDITTLLPDGTNWAPDTDMSRFTNARHPDFWDPCVELEDTPRYCEDDGE